MSDLAAEKEKARKRANWHKYKEHYNERARSRYHSEPGLRIRRIASRRMWRINNPEKYARQLDTKRQAALKLRFEVLERDQFKCVYCGRTSDQVELQIDHVVPVSKGGPTVPSNLVTACFHCNNGKRDKILTAHPTRPQAATE